MKTRAEVEDLKAQWVADPCWDIEATAGFEDEREALEAFHTQQAALWERLDQQRIEMRAAFLGLPVSVMRSLEGLERRLDRLERARLD